MSRGATGRGRAVARCAPLAWGSRSWADRPATRWCCRRRGSAAAGCRPTRCSLRASPAGRRSGPVDGSRCCGRPCAPRRSGRSCRPPAARVVV